MPTTIKEERLRWVIPICNKEVKHTDVAKVYPHSKRSLKRWVSAYKKLGAAGLILKSTRPKSHPNETEIRIKKRIIELRRKTRKRALKLNKYIKFPLSPGKLVEIDVKFVPETAQDKRYFQFTVIDCATRWRYLHIYDDYTNFNSARFLEKVLRIAPFRIRAVKTDNGSNFTNRYTKKPSI